VARPLDDDPMLDPLMHCPTISGFGLPYLTNPGAPSWSPTAPVLAFYGKKRPRRALWLADKRGGVTEIPLSGIEVTQDMWSLTERLHIDSPQWSPDGSRVIVAGVNAGARESSLFVIDLKTSDVVLDTRDFLGHQRGGRWSPDGRSIAYAEWRDAKHDLWILDTTTRKPYQLIFDRFDNRDPQWHPSGGRIAYTTQRSDEDRLITYVAVLDLATGISRIVSPTGGVHSRYPRWSSDGRLYCLSDLGGWDAVWRLDADGPPTRLTPEVSSEVVHYDIASDGETVVYTLSERTDHRLYAARKGHVVPLTTGAGTAWWPKLDPRGERVAFMEQGPTQPPRLRCIGVADGKTRFVVPWVPARDECARVEQVALTSKDGLAVDAVAFRPAGPVRGGIVYIHGGPNAQFTHGWYPFLHHLALRGFAVIAPNARGSNGYGREFMDFNRFDWGGKVIEDWVAAAGWLRAAGAPAEAIGVYGPSYGGYATMLLMGKRPELFHAGVCHAGLYDFTDFFQVTFVRVLAYRSMGLPYYQRSINVDQSPTTHYERIRGPILLTQGELDLGTPAVDAERTVRRLRELGKSVEYALYPGEAHDIVQPAHVRDVVRRITTFLETHLLRTGAV
jgi:dipeptidyl aminopeptidase/acylaminoacyl peptidase